jgi:ABC-2 type transport system ATP-binding protein
LSEVIIQVENLCKHYPPDVKAVDDISFMIKPKQIFSMLGPNGAGKTTTVEILEGLRNPTSGTASIFGVDVTRDYTKIRSRVGVLPQNFEPFDELKPPEAVEYWAGLFDRRISKKEVNDLLESVNLTDRKSLISKKLSGGEKRKLGIALSIINNPELLFLDEPTTGLDPKARRDLWRLVEDIRNKGTTVFLTTHYLDEAEKLSDDVAIMHKGKMIARGSPEELIAKYGKMTVVVLVGAGKDGLKEISRRGIDATTRRQTLEDVFLGLVGAKMEEGVLKE